MPGNLDTPKIINETEFYSDDYFVGNGKYQLPPRSASARPS